MWTVPGKATDIIVMTTSALQAASPKLSQNLNEVDFANGVSIGSMKAFAIHDEELLLDKWELKISDTQIALDKMWLVIRYTLK